MAAEKARRLKPVETALIAAIPASERGAQPLQQELATALVEEMNDGAWEEFGYRTCRKEVRRAGCRGRVQDEDGVVLSITINTDQHGSLFDMDVWKVDFTPLLGLPTPDDFKVLTRS